MPLPVLRRAYVAVPLLLALAAGACSSESVAAPSGQPPASPSASPSAPAEAPAPPQAAPITVDLAPGGAAVTLDNGWVVQHCEGDAPLLCVADADGELLGTMEFASFPANDAIAAAIEEGTVVQALRARADEQHAWVAGDREQGCGEDYTYVPAPVEDAMIGDLPGVAFGFSGTVDGREVERHRAYTTVHAGQFWVVSVAAAAPDGCMGQTELVEFVPADLATFEPYMARIVQGMELPATGTGLTDGIVVGVDGGLDGGMLYVLLEGGKQRIQQPAALTEQDVEERQLVRSPAVAQLTVVDGVAGSYFAVVPPDGADARLQLVVDGVVREVLVQHVDPELLAGIPDLQDTVLDRLRPALAAAS